MINWIGLIMENTALESIAKQLVSPGKGILAADESFPTIEKRFKTVGLKSTQESRRTYRELLFTTPGIEKFISGVILFDETLRQESCGKPIVQILEEKGIILGIKVDQGTEDLPDYPGEKITKGIDGLGRRLEEYKILGAKFTKWRAVFSISQCTPSLACVEKNTDILADFAGVSQEKGFVPIVEPEVLMEGGHDINKCSEVTRMVLKMLFIKVNKKNIALSCLLLKPNMVLPGKDYPEREQAEEIAQKTIEVMREAVPPQVPGIVFLSGGQTPEEATENLREINKITNDRQTWQLSFSYGRALQEPVLKAWLGKEENIKVAQEAFYNRAKMNSEARYGK